MDRQVFDHIGLFAGPSCLLEYFFRDVQQLFSVIPQRSQTDGTGKLEGTHSFDCIFQWLEKPVGVFYLCPKPINSKVPSTLNPQPSTLNPQPYLKSIFCLPLGGNKGKTPFGFHAVDFQDHPGISPDQTALEVMRHSGIVERRRSLSDVVPRSSD